MSLLSPEALHDLRRIVSSPASVGFRWRLALSDEQSPTEIVASVALLLALIDTAEASETK